MSDAYQNAAVAAIPGGVRRWKDELAPDSKFKPQSPRFRGG